MSNSDTERRHFTRVNFDAKAYVNKNDHVWHCQIVDISLHGILLDTPSGWDGTMGDVCTIELPLLPGDVEITVTGKVEHVSAEHIGFSFEEIELDSASHLKRLLELNLGDPNMVKREIHELLEIHTTDG